MNKNMALVRGHFKCGQHVQMPDPQTWLVPNLEILFVKAFGSFNVLKLELLADQNQS